MRRSASVVSSLRSRRASSAASSSSSGGGGRTASACSPEMSTGAQQGRADLVEDEIVEGVGADVAFGAAPVVPAGFDRVVVAAVVVAVPGAVAAAPFVAVHADLAGAAFDQATQ